MESFAYLATAHTPDHDQACLVELRCTRRDLLTYAPFQQLAESICQCLLECPPKQEPKYLDRDNIPTQDRDKLYADCRRETLRRGIPEDDVPEYTASLLQERLGKLCLHELTFAGKSVAAHLAELSRSFGPVFIGRFFKVTAYD